MGMLVVVPPAVEPIAVAEAKLNARAADVAEEDARFTSWIEQMRVLAEDATGRVLITQTRDVLLDAFPLAEIRLPCPPVQSVTSIKYVDTSGVVQTIDAQNYALEQTAETCAEAFILPAYDYAWPAPRAQANAVTIRVVCGYGASGANVPAPIREWMLGHIASMYENREAWMAGTFLMKENPFLLSLIRPYKTYRVL